MDISKSCKSDPIIPIPNSGTFYIRVPVIIAEPLIHINIESIINLPKPAIYIKCIKRKIFIESCNLIPEINKMFINGSVKKVIEYSETMSSNNNIIEGQMKNITLDTPFNCTTDIKYITPPKAINKNYKNNVKAYSKKNDEQTFTESYNEIEKIYGQIISVDFNELNIKEDKFKPFNLDTIYTFKTIRQILSINLAIRFLQNQTIKISS